VAELSIKISGVGFRARKATFKKSDNITDGSEGTGARKERKVYS
jgi:hypothetical protein